MSETHRITFDSRVMSGRPRLREMRVRLKDVTDLMASAASRKEILADYPYLKSGDVTAALEYAAQHSDHPLLCFA